MIDEKQVWAIMAVAVVITVIQYFRMRFIQKESLKLHDQIHKASLDLFVLASKNTVWKKQELEYLEAMVNVEDYLHKNSASLDMSKAPIGALRYMKSENLDTPYIDMALTKEINTALQEGDKELYQKMLKDALVEKMRVVTDVYLKIAVFVVPVLGKLDNDFKKIYLETTKAEFEKRGLDSDD